jgi:hypothetical protein
MMPWLPIGIISVGAPGVRGSVLPPRALYLRPVGFPGFAPGSGRYFASAGTYLVEAFRKAERKLVPVTPGSFLDP